MRVRGEGVSCVLFYGRTYARRDSAVPTAGGREAHSKLCEVRSLFAVTRRARAAHVRENPSKRPRHDRCSSGRAVLTEGAPMNRFGLLRAAAPALVLIF